jgi:hypothetical protein
MQVYNIYVEHYVQCTKPCHSIVSDRRCCHVACLLFFVEDLSVKRAPVLSRPCTSKPQAWGRGSHRQLCPGPICKNRYSIYCQAKYSIYCRVNYICLKLSQTFPGPMMQLHLAGLQDMSLSPLHFRARGRCCARESCNCAVQICDAMSIDRSTPFSDRPKTFLAE